MEDSNEVAVIEKLGGFDENILNLASQADKAEIPNMEICSKAGDLVKLISTQLKKLDVERKSWVDPLNAQVKRFNALFKERKVKLEAAKSTIKAKMDTFLIEEEKRQRAEEAAARRKAEQEAVEAAAKAEASGNSDQAEEIVETAIKAGDKAETKIQSRGDLGSVASIRTTWVHEIIDPDQIPRKYLMINESAIRAAVKNGERAIPGVKVYEKKSTVVR